MKRRLFKRKFLSCQFKKIVVLVLLFMGILAGKALGQIVVDNPDKPKSKNAGRTVILEEVMRIRDDGKNIIFRNPRYLSLLNDGSLFFVDTPYIYKYSKDGQFIFQALKQGQGPGECYGGVYFFMGDRMRVQAWNPPKVLDYDLDGKYIKEIRTNIINLLYFLKYIDGKIYGIRDEIHYSNDIWKEGFIESPFTLYEISEDFQKLKRIYDFPVKHYIKKGHWWRRTMVGWTVDDHYLFALHTAEYRIEKLDLRTGRIERVFKRRYARLKTKEGEVEQDIYNPVPKQNLPPPFDYAFDIMWLHFFKNSLWVLTSATKDNDRKPLIDVFDMEGNYIDNFCLQFPSNNKTHWITNSILSDDGFIFIPEQSEDGFVSIGKYRIKDNL